MKRTKASCIWLGFLKSPKTLPSSLGLPDFRVTKTVHSAIKKSTKPKNRVHIYILKKSVNFIKNNNSFVHKR